MPATSIRGANGGITTRSRDAVHMGMAAEHDCLRWEIIVIAMGEKFSARPGSRDGPVAEVLEMVEWAIERDAWDDSGGCMRASCGAEGAHVTVGRRENRKRKLSEWTTTGLARLVHRRRLFVGQRRVICALTARLIAHRVLRVRVCLPCRCAGEWVSGLVVGELC